MKSILNKIYFHPFFLVSVLIFILIGKFKFICYFMLLISIHELGHILVSLCFKWNIEKIIILPFGGLTKYNEFINRSLIEEFLISISGILFQLVFFILIKKYVDYKYFIFINYFIIIFNLIPIYPLDGSKILNVFFNILFNYKLSILLTVIISYILIIILAYLFFNKNKLISLVLMFLFLEVNKLYKNRNLLFNKFLLERYLGEYKFNKEKIIKSAGDMKKDYRHIFNINNKYLTEKYYLRNLFDTTRKL